MQSRNPYYCCYAFWYVDFTRDFGTIPITCISLVPNVWVRPNNQRKESDAAKQLLTVPDGDHLTLLNVYNEYKTSTQSRTRYPRIHLNSLRPQISTTRIGHGQTIFLLVRSLKPTTSVRSFSVSWSGSIST